MPRLTLVIGGTLTLLGILAYVLTAAASVTALIPAVVGVLLIACGLVAERRPAARPHTMHAALAIALLGALGSLMQVAKLGEMFAGTAERPAAVIFSTVMFLLLVFNRVMGVRSFRAARRARSEA